MATIRIKRTGPAPHDTEIIVEVADEHVAHALAEAIERTHRMGAQEGPKITQPEAPPPRKGSRVKLKGLTETQAVALAKKLPTIPQIVEYIVGRPDKTHSLGSISEHFLGVRLHSERVTHREHLMFFRLQDRTKEARRAIARSDKSGKFEVDPHRVGQPFVYRWKRAT